MLWRAVRNRSHRRRDGQRRHGRGVGRFFRRQRELFTLTLALGAVCWTARQSAFGWAGEPIYACRAVLDRLSGADHRRRAPGTVALPATFCRRAARVSLRSLLVLARRNHGVDLRLTAGDAGAGPGLLGLPLWLMRQDVARRTVKGSGLTRFIAVCLLSGYVWLAVGGMSILPRADSPLAARCMMRRCTRCCSVSCSRWCSATRRSFSRRCCAWPCRITLTLRAARAAARLAADRLAGDWMPFVRVARLGRDAERRRAGGVRARHHRRGDPRPAEKGRLS